MTTTGKDLLEEDDALDQESAASDPLRLVAPNMTMNEAGAPDRAEHKESAFAKAGPRDATVWDFKARGEPFLWGLGGALAFGVLMIAGFLVLILYNGAATFWPRPIQVVKLADGKLLAGELSRSEQFRATPEQMAGLDEKKIAEMTGKGASVQRDLFKIGNFDLYNEDYKWVPEYEILESSTPPDMYYVERMEWGPFIGTVKSVQLNGKDIAYQDLGKEEPAAALKAGAGRRNRISDIERNDIAKINTMLDAERLRLRKVGLKNGKDSPEYKAAQERFTAETEKLDANYQELSKEAAIVKDRDAQYTITLADVNGREKTMKLSQIVRMYAANSLTTYDKIGVYLSRWWEFLTQEPREANTEGGVMPAIFGTFCMTVLMALAVAPFGVISALYLREYARQGRLVSLVRICVNNLAGVPSIVYGVFGLGFFAYMLGGSIDQLFFPERLPTPTFGTGGLLWSSLTLALLTVPVVIVATEEALASVPKSLREGSLACGASKWQTIKYIILPRAMPGIMTGLILAMARGAGEVAPLMLVGVVKMAPELPIDQIFPYIHLDRSFMHLGFHIFDVGFQSRNSEAAKPMVFVTTLLLITLVFVMNAASIMVRNRLKRKFFAGHF
jgi:phosphate transport system permease protein